MLYFHFTSIKKDLWSDQSFSEGVLTIGETAIKVGIARSVQEQAQGLSNTPSLPSNMGELFIFDTPGTYGFWMKDMQYPLDFIWIDASHRIIAITSSVSPDSYPEILYPPSKVSAVLEVNAHFSTIHGITVGQIVTLKK